MMKAKPILKIAAVLLLFGGAVFIWLRYKRPAKNDESAAVKTYITHFAFLLERGERDSLPQYFLKHKKPMMLDKLAGVLSNKTAYNGKDKAVLELQVWEDKIEVKAIGNNTYTVKIPLSISYHQMAFNIPILLLKVQKASTNGYIISKFDARAFLTQYLAYENAYKPRDPSDTMKVNAITLAAFKTADQLKARYDSVLWFQHIDQKTWFYVIKGKWDRKFFWGDYDGQPVIVTHKMGLVNPDLKEIIPTEYDLIHNLGGTIAGLIEVEKDDKKGLFDEDGKKIAPADYDEIIPLTESNTNLAVLRNGDDYFYLKKDLSITDKLSGFKIAEILPQVKNYNTAYTLSDTTSKTILEWNDKEDASSLIISPSYLVGWSVLPKFLSLPNPNRESPDDAEDGFDAYYSVKSKTEKPVASNWFQAAYYAIVADYLGSRGGLYASNAVVIADKKINRVYGAQFGTYHGIAEGGGSLSGKCKDQYLRSIGDSLYEFKATENIDQAQMNGQIISEAPYYHYMHIENGKLVPLRDNRMFAFTQYVKMDDSYLNGCFIVGNKKLDKMDADMLQVAKNEIYASYQYQFKSPKWTEAFENRFDRNSEKGKINVDDSLTAIDKYNIAFINKKLAELNNKNKALAAK